MSTKAKDKKAPKKDVVDELEDQLDGLNEKIGAELDKGPEFGDADAAGDAREPEEEAKTEGDLVGSWVGFSDDAGTKYEGEVIAYEKNAEGATVLVVQDAKGEDWEAKPENVTVLRAKKSSSPKEPEDAAPAGEPELEPTDATAEEAPAEGEGNGGEQEADVNAAPPKKGKKSGKKPAESQVPTRTEKEAVDEAKGYQVILVKVADVKVPKLRPRDLPDKESEDYKAKLRDVKRWELDDPIEVDSRDQRTLCDGLQRLEIFKDLGRKLIPARLRLVEDDNDRLYHGVRRNMHRTPMHWLDLAKAFDVFVREKKMKQVEISKEFGIAGSEVSRMLAAVELPKKILKLARENAYPQNTFLEMAAAPEEAKTRVAELMEAGSDVTALGVRAIAQEERKKKDADAKEKGEKTTAEKGHGGARSHGEKNGGGVSHVDVSSKELDPRVQVRVHRDRAEVTFVIAWENKTFRGLELVKAVKATLNDAFGNAECSIRSEEDLVKAMNQARAGLA